MLDNATMDASTLYLTLGGVFAVYALATIFILPSFSTQAKFLRDQPWVGVQKELLSRLRGSYRTIFNTDSLVLEGYEKYSKKSKTFILPQFARDPFVVLPADKVHEFLAIGDDRVDHKTIGKESIAHKYAIGEGFDDDEHFNVVRRQLTRKLPLLTNDVYHELVTAIEKQWPVNDKEWTTIHTYPTCMKIVSQAANRVFAGKDLCRTPEFLEHSRLYSQAVFQSGAIMKLIPSFLHPILAPIIIRPVRTHFKVCKRLATPIIIDRLQRMKTEGKAYEPANDVLQWVLDDSIASGDPKRLDVDWLCRLLLLLNMVAIHTTSMITTNTFLDMYTSPHAAEYVAGLREEAERVLAQHGGDWSKDAVNSLVRVDSVIRETMRHGSLGSLGLPRIVSDPNGITLSGGIHLPYGVRVVMPTKAIHNDDAFYPNGTTWDGFRFSRPWETFAASQKSSTAAAPSADANEKGRLDKILELKNTSLITTSDEFLTFGAQRHACPGRFFASQEMKLMIAHVVLNYDIQIAGPRPENFHLDGASVPTDTATMQVRRRVR